MRHLLPAVVTVFSACSSGVAPTALASLSCPPADVPLARGVPFHVAAMVTGASPTNPTLSVTGAPDVPPASALSHDFNVDADAILTVTFSADTELGAVSAVCKVQVGDPFAAPADEEESEEPEVDDDLSTGEEDEEEEVEEAGDPVDLNGNFALVAFDLPTITGHALDPTTQCASAKSVSLVRITQTGTHIEMTTETCALPMPTVNTSGYDLIVTTVPPAFLRAMPVLTSSFDLARGRVGDRFTPVAFGTGQSVGADVPDDAPLPRAAGEPGEVDSDQNDLPGGTLHVGTDDRNIAYRRFIDAFDGVVLSNDEIDGSADGSWLVNSETTLLDWPLSALQDFLGTSVSGNLSRFKMVRTSFASCDELMARPSLLPSPARPDLGDCAHFDAGDGAPSADPTP